MEQVQQHEFMRLEKEGKLAWITFTREHKLNAVNSTGTIQLLAIAKALREDPDVRIIIIRGEGGPIWLGKIPSGNNLAF
jgi:enoyl-CoA hydratase/carnithine racemase